MLWYGINPKDSDLSANVIYAEECNKMVKDLGLGSYFKLLPKRQDIQKAYREADIFCLPSHFEGTPNTICEAMACGLPIMASNVCDNARFVKAGKNGWLFNPENVDDMAAAIITVASIPRSILYEFGKNSRKIAENICSEQDYTEKYIKLIEAV